MNTTGGYEISLWVQPDQEYDWHTGLFDLPHNFWVTHRHTMCGIEFCSWLRTWG